MKHVELIAGTTLGVLVMMCGVAAIIGVFNVPAPMGILYGLTIVLCGVAILYNTSRIYDDACWQEEQAKIKEIIRYNRKLRG